MSTKPKVQVLYKKVKHANLRVKPSMEVFLTVPIGTKQAEIDTIILSRKDWISTQLEFFNNQPKKSIRKLVSGEDFEYLGNNYSIKVIESEQEIVKLSGEFLCVYVKNQHNLAHKKYLIDIWYYEMAEIHFKKIIEKYIVLVNRPINKVRIRRMKTRWGSCNPTKAYINLNIELIKKPISSIEYVVFHELTHLIHYNHDKKFYGFIESHMPDWKIRKNKLG